MYNDKVTVFCRYGNRSGDTWYPHVISADFNADKAAIISTYGENSTDNARLHVKFKRDGKNKLIEGLRYLQPKEWENQVNEELGSSITFQDGLDFGFFWLGEWEDTNPIDDNQYVDGFYSYMNEKYDNVFSISKWADYSVIPHVEVFGR